MQVGNKSEGKRKIASCNKGIIKVKHDNVIPAILLFTEYIEVDNEHYG